MSETLRDLVVSLSLDSDNFSRNITSVTKQIREAESTFKLAGAGVESFEKTTQGLTSKLGMLEIKLGHQKNVVAQYERALDAANVKLKESVANNEKIRSALDQAKAKYSDLGSQIELARTRYDAWNSAVGEGHAKTIAAKTVLDALEKEYAETGAEIKKLEGQLVSTQKAMQLSADKVSQANINLNNARAALKDVEAQIKSTNAALATAQSKWTTAGTAFSNFAKSAEKVSKTSKKIGSTLTKTLTAPIVALGSYALKTSIDFEDAFAGVRKTVNMTESEFAALDQSIKNMTLVKPASYETIAFVAETAGQLGIAKHAVEGFTSVMTDLGAVSTDLSAADRFDLNDLHPNHKGNVAGSI